MRRSPLSGIWYCICPPVLMVALNVFIYLGAVLVYQAFFGSSYADADAFMDSAGGIISIICYIAGIAVFAVLYRRDGNEASGLLFSEWFYIPAVCVFGALASHGLSILVSLVNIDGILGSYAESSSSLFAYGAVFVIVRTVILAPLVEELVFRGLLFRRIEGFLGFWPAALLSAAAFGVYHLNLAQGIFAFLFGILFCLILRRFASLWACIFMHAAANLLSVILEYSGADYGSTGAYVIVMAACLAAAAGLYFGIIRGKKERSR